MPAFFLGNRWPALVLTASAVAFGTAACSAGSQVPAVDFPSAATVQPFSVQLDPVPSFTGYAPPLGAVATTITGLPATTVLSYTKILSWVDFTVTLTNTSDSSLVDIEPLVVFGQCSCDPQFYDIAPHTSVQVWEPDAQTWKAVTSADLNSNQAYSEQQQVPGINLGPDAAASFRYRIAMDNPVKEKGLLSGDSSLNIFVLQLPGRSRLSVGLAPDATAALAYRVG
jgi:hypothetical protein